MATAFDAPMSTNEKLLSSEEKYRLLFESVSDVIYSLDTQFKVLSISPSVEQVLGYKPEEVIGRSFADLNILDPDSLALALPNVPRILSGEKTTATVLTFIARDGSQRIAEVSGTPMYRSGKVVGITAVARDVTERRRAEDALRRLQDELEERVRERTADLARMNDALQAEVSERKRVERELRSSSDRLKVLFTHAPDGYYLSDLKGHFLDGNRAAEELIGYKREELIGKSFLKVKLLPKSQLPRAAALLVRNALGQPTGPDEFSVVRKDGTRVPVEISTFPVKIDGKTVILSLARNIGERKQTEEKLRQAKEAAESANRAKSDFLANMSHELRTPLNHIIGFTELTLDKAFGELNAVQEEHLHDVLQSSRHLLSLINDILDLSKVEAGKENLDVGDVNLEFLLEGSLNMFTETALKHGIDLTTRMGEIPATIKADERKLKQILYNLLSNAVKFTPSGGRILLSSNTMDGRRVQEEVKARMGTSPESSGQHPPPPGAGEYVHFSVQDTGIGLRPQDLERIFHPFEQVESSLSRRYPGTGLGLPLARRFVEMHGGAIWAESDGEGKGATVRFVIPV